MHIICFFCMYFLNPLLYLHFQGSNIYVLYFAIIRVGESKDQYLSISHSDNNCIYFLNKWSRFKLNDDTLLMGHCFTAKIF